MSTTVGEIMMSLADYAIVDEEATLLEALEALRASLEKLPADKQPHRAVLVRNHRGEIIGKVHHFAFLRALVPDRRSVNNLALLERAGVGDDLRESSMRMLDLLTGDLVNICERARSVKVRDFYTSATVSVQESAPLSEAVQLFLSHQTLSLLVRRREETVGILRLSDLFDELSRQILEGSCND